MAAMAELPLAAVVVEGSYPKLFEARFVKDGWLPEWTYRFLATALADLDHSADAGEVNQNGMSSPSPSQSDPSAEAAVSDGSAAATSRRRSSSR